jgi:hypothetical protein
MKYLQLVCLLFLIASCNDQNKPRAVTQPGKDSGIVRKEPSNPFAAADISPMDISYFPVDYTVKKMSGATTKDPVARVIYSRPHRGGRSIFGSLLKYGEAWRLGANESTEIELFQPITIQNKNIPAGRYIMYCIPYQDKWTIIFNSNIYTWGLKHQSEKDVHKFDVPVQKPPTSIEYFTMVFEKTTNGADLIMTWDEVLVRLPMNFTY